MPVFMPKPPVGVNRCTASPASSTRLVDESLGHQRDARGPRPVAEDLIGSSAPMRTMHHLRYRRVGGETVVLRLGESQELLVAVERDDGAAPLRVDDPVLPAGPVREMITVERRCADIRGILRPP